MDLLADAEGLANDLEAANTSGHDLKQRCVRFVVTIRSFAASWNRLSRVLRDHQLHARVVLQEALRRLTGDMEDIFQVLSMRLDDCLKENQNSRRRLRRLLGYKATHAIVLFMDPKSKLRRKQIKYAVSVVDLVYFTALHAMSFGYRSSSKAALKDVLAQQRLVVEKEWQACRELNSMEASVSDDIELRGAWVDGYRLLDTDLLPLRLVASIWFAETLAIADVDLTLRVRQLEQERDELKSRLLRYESPSPHRGERVDSTQPALGSGPQFQVQGPSYPPVSYRADRLDHSQQAQRSAGQPRVPLTPPISRDASPASRTPSTRMTSHSDHHRRRHRRRSSSASRNSSHDVDSDD